ncbi:hypothetical protein AAHA92_02687 [Salvia divinorum]|uniref:Uncharacterized protein n=1 Tax=Salvia divinorum TaxID=28513 RepID=A0ABD1IHC2_SALDI
MVGYLLITQQYLQNNMQTNNDVVHKLQDSQREQKAVIDMIAQQLSQIATSLNEMRGNEGRTLTTVKTPGKENISQIVLRSGKTYDGPIMQTENGDSSSKGGMDSQLIKETVQVRDNMNLRSEDLGGPLPQMDDPFFLDPEDEVAVDEDREKEEDTKERVPPECHDQGVQQTKPFPYRGEAKKKKEDPVDFMEIFGKLEINLPFLQALKLFPFSRFIKEFIAGKAKTDGKIMIGENVSAVIQKRKLP